MVKILLKDNIKKTSKADKIRAELQKIANYHHTKQLKVEHVLAYIKKNTHSILYKELEWDDKIAGEQYRKQQIINIIDRYVIVVYGHNNVDQVDFSLEDVMVSVGSVAGSVREEIGLDVDGTAGYIPAKTIMDSETLSGVKCLEFGIMLKGFLRRWDVNIYKGISSNIKEVDKIASKVIEKFKKYKDYSVYNDK